MTFLSAPICQYIMLTYFSETSKVPRDMAVAYIYRLADLAMFSFMTLFTLIVWAYLLYALRRFQYVYYQDHFVKINAQFTSMILFSFLSL
jgi:hypothetical protein